MAYIGEHFEFKIPPQRAPLAVLKELGGRLWGGNRTPDFAVASNPESPWEGITRGVGRAILRSQSLGEHAPSLQAGDGVTARSEWLANNVTLPLPIRHDNELQAMVGRLMEGRGKILSPEADAVSLLAPSDELIANSRHVDRIGLVAVHSNMAVGEVYFRGRFLIGRMSDEELHDLQVLTLSIGVHVDGAFDRHDPGQVNFPAPPTRWSA